MSLFLFVAAAWVTRTVTAAAELSDREGLRQAELAIRQAAVSCYALDGELRGFEVPERDCR